MDAGIALDFSLRFPKRFETYCHECTQGKIHLGTVYFYEGNGQKILNFPTKGNNPLSRSELSFIIDGLIYFKKTLQRI